MKVRFLNDREFAAAEEARLALAKSRTDGKQGASLREITGPGVMWSVPWYFDPLDPDDTSRRLAALAAIADGTYRQNSYLSRMYWQQWSDKRAPLSVLCPNGREWCVDAKSSNGDGWTVVGEPPLVTCSPSISVPGYHGFLQNGEFTADCEGRGPNGAAE